MKKISSGRAGLLAAGCLILGPLPVCAHDQSVTNSGYAQINLVSDIATNASHTDSRLINPWGLVAGLEAVWVNDNGTGLATVYGAFGRLFAFDIHVPAPGGGKGTPSGMVFNNTSTFEVTNRTQHAPSTLLMATEDGTITAWNYQLTGSNAVIAVDNSPGGAVYKGLAIAYDVNGHPLLYAANFHAGVVDVFNGLFQQIASFTDSNVPPHFAPFNVRNIRGRLFVTFALQKLPDAHDDESGAGNGFVDIFDTDGTLLRNFAAQGPLNSPWGMAVAPAHFGKFSNALLVGNFGDGRINAYDLLTGKLLGHFTRPNGADVVIDGLWGLTFEAAPPFGRECEFEAERLYFSAGLNGENDGLLGFIRAVSPHFPPAR